MRRALTQTLLATLFVASAASAARAQSAPQKSEPPPRAIIRIDPEFANPSDFGKLEGGAYSNDFFGFSLMLPEGWFVLGTDDNKKIMDKGRQAVEESAPEKKKAGLEASLARTSILLSTSKYRPGTPGPEPNAMFVCVAERILTDLVKTGADYLSLGQRSLAGTAKLEFAGPVRTEKVGGVEFTVADLKLTAGSVVRTRRQYVRIMKGYALILAYVYFDEADLKTFDGVLGTVKFK